MEQIGARTLDRHLTQLVGNIFHGVVLLGHLRWSILLARRSAGKAEARADIGFGSTPGQWLLLLRMRRRRAGNGRRGRRRTVAGTAAVGRLPGRRP